VARKDETLPTPGTILLRTIKSSSRRTLRDLRIIWNRNAIQYFPATNFTKEHKQSQFVTRNLRLLVRECSFKEPDEMIRDRIVFGRNSRKIREKLVNEGKELTHDRAVDIARTYEMSQMKSMEAGDEAIDSVNRSAVQRRSPKAKNVTATARYMC